MTSRAAAFVSALSTLSAPGCFNPWAESAPDDAPGNGPAARAARLTAHLSVQARVVLIGEGLSYMGGRCSGVAFTSERLTLEGRIPRVTAAARLSTRELPWSEPSATIVWKNLGSLRLSAEAVLWNAFPLHPHRPESVFSNRAPSKPELTLGADILKAMLGLYPGALVLAVGENSRRSLAALGVQARAARHPAFGGAPQFARHLRDAVEHAGLLPRAATSS